MTVSLLTFLYFIGLFLLSVLMNHYYSRKLGIEKIKKFIHFKEKEVNEKIANKILSLEDVHNVLSIESKKFHHLKVEIEKNLYALDGKLNQVNESSRQFKKNLKDFESFEGGLKQTLLEADKYLQKLEEQEGLSKKIEHELKVCMQEIAVVKKTVSEVCSKTEEELNVFRENATQGLKEDIGHLTQQVTEQKGALEDSFSEKIDEVQVLNEQLKTGMQEKQEELFTANESKISAFFNEQIHHGKEEIDAIRSTFQESEKRFHRVLAETEERQKRISETQQSFYQEFDGYKEKVTQKISDASDTILEAFKNKIQDYERNLVIALEDKYQGFSKKASSIEAELKTKEEQTIQEADEKFQTIQNSIIDYQNMLSSQVEEITKQYHHIKEELIKKNQKELKRMTEHMVGLEANFAKVENINQIKTERLNHLMKYIDEAKGTIQQKVKGFEGSFLSLEGTLKELEGEKLGIVLEKGGKLKKRINEVVRKELAGASHEMKAEQKAMKKQANTYLEELKHVLLEKGSTWQEHIQTKYEKDISLYIETSIEKSLFKEKKNAHSLMRGLEAELKQIISHSEEEIAALKDKYNEMNVFVESIEEELSLMQAKRSDFQNLEEKIKSLYEQQTQAASQIESSLREKALEKLEDLEAMHQSVIKELSAKKGTLMEALNTLRQEGSSIKQGFIQVETEARDQLNAFLEQQKHVQSDALQKTNLMTQAKIDHHLKDLSKTLIKIEADFHAKSQSQVELNIKTFEATFQERNDTLDQLVHAFHKEFERQKNQHASHIVEQQNTIESLTAEFIKGLKLQENKSKAIYETHSQLDEQIQFLKEDKEKFFSDVKDLHQDIQQEKQDLHQNMKVILKSFQQEATDKIKGFIAKEEKSQQQIIIQSSEAFIREMKQSTLESEKNFENFIYQKELSFDNVLKQAHDKIEDLQSQEIHLQKTLQDSKDAFEHIEQEVQKQTSVINTLKEGFAKHELNAKQAANTLFKDFEIHQTNLAHQNQKVLQTLEAKAKDALNNFSSIEKNRLQADLQDQTNAFNETIKTTQQTVSTLQKDFHTQMSQEIQTLKRTIDLEVKQASQSIKALSYKKDKRFMKFANDFEQEIINYQETFQNLLKKQRSLEVKLSEKNEEKIKKQILKIETLIQNKNQEATTGTKQLHALQKQTQKLIETENQLLDSLKEKTKTIKAEYQNEIQFLTKSHHKSFSLLVETLQKETKDKVNERLENEFHKVKYLSQTLHETTTKFDVLHDNYKASINEQQQQIKSQLKDAKDKMHHFIEVQKTDVEKTFEAIHLNLKDQENIHSQKTKKQFENIHQQISQINNEINRFISQTDLFKQVDTLKSKVDQHLITYTEKTNQIKADTIHTKTLEKQVLLIKDTHHEVESLMKKINLKKHDLVTLTKNMDLLKQLSEDTHQRIQNIETTKQDINTFLSHINTYHKESQTIKTTFQTIMASKEEVDTLLQHYKTLLKQQTNTQQKYHALETQQGKIKITHIELRQTLNTLEDKCLSLENNQEKLLEFNEKYEQLDMALQDVTERKKGINKMRQELNQEKQALLEIKNTLNEQIKFSLKIIKKNKFHKQPTTSHLSAAEESATELSESVLSLHQIGWNKEEIAKHLHLEIYEVELMLQQQDPHHGHSDP